MHVIPNQRNHSSAPAAKVQRQPSIRLNRLPVPAFFCINTASITAPLFMRAAASGWIVPRSPAVVSQAEAFHRIQFIRAREEDRPVHPHVLLVVVLRKLLAAAAVRVCCCGFAVERTHGSVGEGDGNVGKRVFLSVFIHALGVHHVLAVAQVDHAAVVGGGNHHPRANDVDGESAAAPAVVGGRDSRPLEGEVDAAVGMIHHHCYFRTSLVAPVATPQKPADLLAAVEEVEIHALVVVGLAGGAVAVVVLLRYAVSGQN
jgi:hypothetical protein